MEKLLETRFDAAVELRKRMRLPSADTNAYRLVNSEGDRLSGLIVDVFGDIAVVASSAAWVEKYRPEIEFHVCRVNGVNHVKWRPSIDILKEEGLAISEDKGSNPSPYTGRVTVMENGICYLVSLEGQKTGFYADQRENRHLISLISKDQKVLDVCCYTGGFAFNAACGGATDVIGIDSSLPALDLAKENIIRNKLDPAKISFLKEDATQFMKGALSRNESWDLVILDPPKLAPKKKVLQSASGMYRKLNSLAMQVTKRGGLLMTCSCSGAMTQSGSFLHILQGSEWDFGVFSGIVGVEKSHPKIYEIALEQAGNVAPEEVLHIGDSMRKDYIPARSIGMHGLLVDRFKTADAQIWRHSGAPVVPDLIVAQDWILKEEAITAAQQV